MVGYAAGSGVGQKVYHAAKTVVKTAAKVAKKVVEGAKQFFGGLLQGAASLLGFA